MAPPKQVWARLKGRDQQIVSPRQNQGSCGELIEHISEEQKEEEAEQYLAKKKVIAMKSKVMIPFVEPFGAGGHNITSSFRESGPAADSLLLPQTHGNKPFSWAVFQ